MSIISEAKKASGNNRLCGKCPFHLHGCNMQILKNCHNQFIQGFKKGVEYARKNKNNQK